MFFVRNNGSHKITAWRVRQQKFYAVPTFVFLKGRRSAEAAFPAVAVFWNAAEPGARLQFLNGKINTGGLL